MTPLRPTKTTPAGRAYLDLQRLARTQSRPVDELMQLYALEGFLDRLSRSAYANQLVLKGGVLMSAYGGRRPTRDIDFQGLRISNDAAHLLDTVRAIGRLAADDDGLVFDTESARSQVIRDQDDYSGVRVSMTSHLATARVAFHVDVSVGDPVWPPPRVVTLPRLLGGTLEVTGYPSAMVLAEKIVTALQRGTANTRWRDFLDVHALMRQPHSEDELRRAIKQVATYRSVEIVPLAVALDGYGPLMQVRWSAWRRRNRLDGDAPEEFAELVDQSIAFADPILVGTTTNRTWSPALHRWTGP